MPRKRAFRPESGEVRVTIGAVEISRLGVQVAGTIDSVGPDCVGFAVGDRVAFRALATPQGERIVVPDRGLIGIPKDVSLEAAARVFPAALVGRTVVRHTRPVFRGDRVSITSRTGIEPFLEVWVERLGATVVAPGQPADVVLGDRELRAAAAWSVGPGLAQQAAADIFAAIREGAFDMFTAATARREVTLSA